MSEPAIDYTKMSEAELDALFEEAKNGPPQAPEPVPAAPVQPQAPVEEAAPVETPAAPADAVETEEVKTEVDAELAALEVERERLRREKVEADLEAQKAHASRLAGKIGYLEEQLKSIPRASEPYEPQSQAELDRLTTLENELRSEKQRRLETEVSQAIEGAVSALDGPWTKELAAELAVIVPQHADQIRAAKETSDPVLARQIVTAAVMQIKAEAMESALSTRYKGLQEKRAVQVAELIAKKKAASASGGGAVSAPRPLPKTYDQMTPEELDIEMEKEFGRR